MKFDLGWGNSVAVREAFVNTYHGNPLYLAKEELAKYDYPAHEGDPELVEITKKVIERQTGLQYRHVFMVNGATGGVVIALRAYAQRGLSFAMTRKAPFYGKYPIMIEAAGMKHVEQDSVIAPEIGLDTVHLVDMPSNPLGLMTDIVDSPIHHAEVIIDGVYLNNVYAPRLIKYIPAHDVMIGSYSKLLGINGIRVGWLATNDDLLASRFQTLVTAEYCGLAMASTDILKHSLYGFDWDRFEASAKFKLDCNREEWQQLERFFGNALTPENGMFYYGPMDAKAQDIFARANVTWTKGSTMGTGDGFARFNLGAKNEVIEAAVKAVLKADRA